MIGEVNCDDHTHAEAWVTFGDDNLQIDAVCQLITALTYCEQKAVSRAKVMPLWRQIDLSSCHTDPWGDMVCKFEGDDPGGGGGGGGGTPGPCRKVCEACFHMGGKWCGDCRACKREGY